MAPIKRSRVDKARQYLTGGAVFREDSDDELGYEDHPWEWIYDNATADDTPKENATPRKRKAAPTVLGERIVGARMGSFKCKVGDAVLLKAEGNQAWVGIICDFHEDVEEDEKMAKFLWFSSEKEIRNKNKKRTDFLPASQLHLPPYGQRLTMPERIVHLGQLRRQSSRLHQRHCQNSLPR
jgi:origin recognition complex subunit 1